MRLHTFNHARPDLTPYGFTCELWKGALMRRPDRHNEIELNLMLRGALTYLIGGRRVVLTAGRLGAFWAAQPHQIIGSEGNPQYFVVTLPLAWFLQCEIPGPLGDRLLGGEFLSECVESRFDLDQALFGQWQRDLPGRNQPPVPAVVLELHARLQRFAGSFSRETAPRRRTQSSASSAINTGKAEQMAGFIARHYQEQLSITDVARHVHLHPNYAMTLFRRTFKGTLNQYLNHHRLAEAQRRLATSQDKVLDIAFESGFKTSSRFYEAFKQSCGVSPNQYRRDHRNAELGFGS